LAYRFDTIKQVVKPLCVNVIFNAHCGRRSWIELMRSLASCLSILLCQVGKRCNCGDSHQEV
jgi:hypothetical protein